MQREYMSIHLIDFDIHTCCHTQLNQYTFNLRHALRQIPIDNFTKQNILVNCHNT